MFTNRLDQRRWHQACFTAYITGQMMFTLQIISSAGSFSWKTLLLFFLFKNICLFLSERLHMWIWELLLSIMWVPQVFKLGGKYFIY